MSKVERIMKQSNEVNIGKIQTDIEYIKSDIIEIKNEIKELKAGFVTRTEYIEAKTNADEIYQTFLTKIEFKPYKATLIIIGTAVVLGIANSLLMLIGLRWICKYRGFGG